jgi:hypothetical protein
MARRFIQKILERIVISLCVILCLQLPFFITQYSHQLRGHIDELKWQVEQMEKSAALSGKTLDEYIAKFRNNSDHDFASQGMMMRTVIHRLEKMFQAWMHVKNSSSFTRPFVFFRYVEWDIFSATFSEFKTGISFTLESMVFGLLGIFLGSSLCSLITMIFNRKKRTSLPIFSGQKSEFSFF